MPTIKYRVDVCVMQLIGHFTSSHAQIMYARAVRAQCRRGFTNLTPFAMFALDKSIGRVAFVSLTIVLAATAILNHVPINILQNKRRELWH